MHILDVIHGNRPKLLEANLPDRGPIESALTEIKELGELRDQGLVTPEEFKTKRLEVLKRL